MKKILLIVIAVLAILAVVVTVFNVGATDAEGEAILQTEAVTAESEIATVEDSDTAATEDTEVIQNTETAELTEDTVQVDTEDLNDAISSSQSKTEAIVKLAEKLGISLSEAEALVDKFVAFGDEHFEESDMWLIIRNDITEHPDKWTIIAIAVLGFVALLAFIIRGLIKNTLTQTNTKLKLADIVAHEGSIDGKLESLGKDNEDIRETIAGVKLLLEGESAEIKRENEELKGVLETIRASIAEESAAVDSLKANSETSLAVTEETSLQILQLVNIALDRKVPIAGDGARKLWYDDAVAKVKAKAGLTDAEAGEHSEG